MFRKRDIVVLVVCLCCVLAVYILTDRGKDFGTKSLLTLDPTVVPGYHLVTGEEVNWLKFPVTFATQDSTWALNIVNERAKTWATDHNLVLVEGIRDYGLSSSGDSIYSVCFLLKN